MPVSPPPPPPPPPLVSNVNKCEDRGAHPLVSYSNSMIVNKCEGWGWGWGGGGRLSLNNSINSAGHVYYIYVKATNASCANSNRRPGRPGRLCKRLHMQRSAEEEKSVSDYRFLLQTPHRHCAVTVCGNLIGNKSALCSTCVSV